jgi:hypothetical protein
MTTIFLARHGQTDWNAQRRWQGHADPPLNEQGRAESRALAEKSPHTESLRKRGYEVLFMTDAVDSFAVEGLALGRCRCAVAHECCRTGDYRGPGQQVVGAPHRPWM